MIKILSAETSLGVGRVSVLYVLEAICASLNLCCFFVLQVLSAFAKLKCDLFTPLYVQHI